jgi:D-inositol-3-phosphate glycosyltransferase
VIYTAHNVRPKGKNSLYDYLVFYIIYRLVHHIICHTKKMKHDLISMYNIESDKVSIIPHGLNYSVPIMQISQAEARSRLGIAPQDRVLLLFGGVRPYKGYEVVLQALTRLGTAKDPWLLIVAGGSPPRERFYRQMLQDYVEHEGLHSLVRFYGRVSDDEVELFFEAADVLILPYIAADFQSGVLFLAYRFGIPIIASNVGSFPEEIENGVRGYIFRTGDSVDLAAKIQQFYQELYKQPATRQYIQQYAMEKYSWERIGRTMLGLYQQVHQD